MQYIFIYHRDLWNKLMTNNCKLMIMAQNLWLREVRAVPENNVQGGEPAFFF